MQNEVQALNLYKKPLQWKSKVVRQNSSENSKGDVGENDFSDLLYELRTDLKLLKDDEGRIRGEIDRTLVDVEKNLGGNDFLRIFDKSMARLNAEIESAEAEVRQLASSLKVIYVLADNISGRVSALDTARSRVVECLQRVSDLRDLRTCAEGVKAAMAQEEFDEAARHVHRFFALDSAVFKMGGPVEAEDSMKLCYETLRQAASDLKAIIERKFDEARSCGDFASMERFFKIFPLINEHSSGLRRFAEYLCSKIETLGDENFKILQAGGMDDKRKNVIYADTLTLVFEGIARLIELHQPLIDSFYGPDKLLLLLELIQAECDKQSIRIVNAFVQKRQIEYKSKHVDAYLRNGSLSSEDKIDALELDVLLSEVTLMHTRAELYWRFLKRRLGEAPARPLSESFDGAESKRARQLSHQSTGEISSGSAARLSADKSPPHSPVVSALPEVEFFEDGEECESAAQRRAALQRMREERNQKLDTLLHRTALNLKMQEILGKYVLMEQYYMIETVKKAIEMDDVEEGSLTSTILDDVFFIVRKSIRRSISSSSVDCVCAMLNNGVTLLETEFIKHVNAPIRAGYPSVGWTSEAYQTAAQTAQTAYHVIQQAGTAATPKTAATAGSGGAEKETSATERQKSAFLIALNNLRASVECVNTLRSGLSEDFARHLAQISDLEKSKLENSVAQLDDLCKKLEYYAHLGVSKLCEAAFRAKIKTNAEEYLDISHLLSDEQLAEYEAVDPFIETFVSQLDKHIAMFESSLIPDNYQALIVEVSIESLQQFERCVGKCAFNRLGALQLDKEFRQLTSYLTSIAGWVIREKCARLSQIVALLNSETFDEAIEFLQQQRQMGGPGEAILTLSEIKKILVLRADFPSDKVRQLRI